MTRKRPRRSFRDGGAHLEIVVDRLLREYNVNVNVANRASSTARTIQKAVEIDGRFEKELGEKKHFGHVKLVLEPLSRGTGIEISNEIPPETIPAEFSPRHRRVSPGSRFQRCPGGISVLDVRIRITGGSAKEGRRHPWIQDRHGHGLQRRLRQGRPGAAGADHAGRHPDAEGVHGRGHRRHQRP